MTETYYTTLNVTRSSSADDIKKQFRKLAVKHHPDKNPGNAAAEVMMKKLNEAYAILGDSVARAKYNRQLDDANRPPPQQNNWHQNHQQHSGGGFTKNGHTFEGWEAFIKRTNKHVFDDLFENVFMDMFQPPKHDHIIIITVSPAEAKTGCQKPFTYVKTIRCTSCLGRTLYSAGCSNCIEGAITLKAKNQSIFLPANMLNDSYWQSPAELVEHPSGKKHDLYIRVQISDPDAPNVNDAMITEMISLEIAFKGGKYKFQAPRGIITVILPPLTYSGKQVKVKNRGYFNNITNQYGDLYLTCIVEYPQNPTQTEVMQLEKLKEKKLRDEKYNS